MNSTLDLQLQAVADAVLNSTVQTPTPSPLVEVFGNVSWTSNPVNIVIFAIVSFVVAFVLIYGCFGYYRDFDR